MDGMWQPGEGRAVTRSDDLFLSFSHPRSVRLPGLGAGLCFWWRGLRPSVGKRHVAKTTCQHCSPPKARLVVLRFPPSRFAKSPP
jgi:hypothetical protein